MKCGQILASSFFRACKSNCVYWPVQQSARLSQSLSELNNQPKDHMYRNVLIELQSHDSCVLNSYEQFIKMTSEHLDVEISSIEKPQRFIERWSLLKSKFVHKKHWKQYEFRTYFRNIEVVNITGSTLSTFLEYVQRNIPEGVLMIVRKTRLEPFSEEMLNRIRERLENEQSG